MGLGYTEELATKVAPARMFEAVAVDMHNLGQKIMPEMIAGAKIVEGDGGVGTIKQMSFTEAFPWECVKESIDVLDRDNLECHYTLFDAVLRPDAADTAKKIKSGSFVLKIVPSSDGGCVYKTAAEFSTIPGVEFTEEDVQMMREQEIGQFKAVEAYLLANPAAYA
ncbi:uncharacterized protein A4U43_C02F21580 [Asparagus officinalis]|uniref:Bet v I/Major latex protein domain-containing protein n=1 Tax=Asparagus officinalis TaxID=4686 RepID=A0A5P1FK09_ASPOF|nr:major allergen Pru ar 1-like [Asparagus officinalis]ONK78705.1 uncharacterized protein A4U43_C02F21580 [Asparagus officinalis]